MSYRGLYVDLAVPRDQRGEPFERRFVVHVQQMSLVATVAGVIVNGPLLSEETLGHAQRERLAQLAVEAAPAGFPVWYGVPVLAADDAVAGVEIAAKLPTAGVILMPTKSAGVLGTLAAAYSWTVPTVVLVDGDDLDEEAIRGIGTGGLAPSVVAVAIAHGPLARYDQLLAAVGARIDVLPYSTSGVGVVERLALGGSGAIIAAANAAPRDFGRLIAAAAVGDWATAGQSLPRTARTSAAVSAEQTLHSGAAGALGAVLAGAGTFPDSHAGRPRSATDISGGN
jgi:dihydrodipicolinate synthase/N-acetylneuraminate lyase